MPAAHLAARLICFGEPSMSPSPLISRVRRAPAAGMWRACRRASPPAFAEATAGRPFRAAEKRRSRVFVLANARGDPHPHAVSPSSATFFRLPPTRRSAVGPHADTPTTRLPAHSQSHWPNTVRWKAPQWVTSRRRVAAYRSCWPTSERPDMRKVENRAEGSERFAHDVRRHVWFPRRVGLVRHASERNANGRKRDFRGPAPRRPTGPQPTPLQGRRPRQQTRQTGGRRSLPRPARSAYDRFCVTGRAPSAGRAEPT